jgi:GDP-mannose 6-dehydrogenase
VSCNTWHALKVAFANEIDAIAREIGANGVEVMKLFVSDKLLNISEAYLKPGFAFGGSCLPKDTSSLSNIAAKLGCKLIPAINPSNEFVIDSWVSRFLAYEYDVVNWVGITFKEHTDDVRDSPYLIALDRILTLSKVRVNFFDPHFTSKAFGRNKEIYWDLKLRSNITIVDSLDLLDSNILTFVAHDYKSLGISDRFSHFLKIV